MGAVSFSGAIVTYYQLLGFRDRPKLASYFE
jgi:hypothetical protein